MDGCLMASAGEIRRIFDAMGTDKGSYHNYENIYELVGTPKTVLELGVYEGASMVSWYNLWPNAEIWGIDIDLRHLRTMPNDRVHIIRGDAYATPPVLDPSLTFDLIVDDADHRWWMQQHAFNMYWPRLKEGGWYVLEDISDITHLRLPPSGTFCNSRDGNYCAWVRQKERA